MNEAIQPMMRVRDWDRIYENNRSREMKADEIGSRRLTTSVPIATSNWCQTMTAPHILGFGWPC